MPTKSKCFGCGLRVQFGHRKVCKLTPMEITDIKDCPCKICLFKMMCSSMCYNFVDTFDHEYKWRFKVNALRPNRWRTKFEINVLKLRS
jgi:hypothetical protein